MQGPAGVRTDFPPVETEENSLGDLEPGGMRRPNGIVGPVGRSPNLACDDQSCRQADLPALCETAGPLDRAARGETKAEDAAEIAAADAHGQSNNPDDVIAALEAAEAKYDQANPEQSLGDSSCH